VRTVAAAVFCKTPTTGLSKTRLSPPLRGDECAALSACFLRDVAATIGALTRDGDVSGYAVYTPAGSEQSLRRLLPADFRLVLQGEGDLGARLLKATDDLLAAGHAGAILINSDSPTLPLSILRAAADALRRDDAVVLGPALDGGYTLVGLSQPHRPIFEDIPWSTPQVYERTIERAREIGLPVISLPQWYDIDDGDSLRLLEAELAGEHPPFAAPGIIGAHAPVTREFFATRAAVAARSAGRAVPASANGSRERT
jgi:rSAM/selenodomain-associated transferase 1